MSQRLLDKDFTVKLERCRGGKSKVKGIFQKTSRKTSGSWDHLHIMNRNKEIMFVICVSLCFFFISSLPHSLLLFFLPSFLYSFLPLLSSLPPFLLLYLPVFLLLLFIYFLFLFSFVWPSAYAKTPLSQDAFCKTFSFCSLCLLHNQYAVFCMPPFCFSFSINHRMFFKKILKFTWKNKRCNSQDNPEGKEQCWRGHMTWSQITLQDIIIRLSL